jgi:hypothetical protein
MALRFRPNGAIALEELVAQGGGDRLGPVEDQPHGGEVQPVEPPGLEHLEKMLVAEIRGTEQRGAALAGFLQPQQRAAAEQARIHDGVLDPGAEHA